MHRFSVAGLALLKLYLADDMAELESYVCPTGCIRLPSYRLII